MSESKLNEAICAVMAEVGYVPKTGRNDHGRYDYASETDLLGKLQPAMASHGLSLRPMAMAVLESTRNGKGNEIMHIAVTYELLHTSGEARQVMALGSGQDNLDKALYKAMTGAYKYALRQTFAIPTGDDPDHAPTAKDVATARRSETPSQAEQRKSSHDPSWESDRAAFAAAVAPYGGYDAAKAFCVAQGWGAPSTWTTDNRRKFVADLNRDSDLARAVKEMA